MSRKKTTLKFLFSPHNNVIPILYNYYPFTFLAQNILFEKSTKCTLEKKKIKEINMEADI